MIDKIKIKKISYSLLGGGAILFLWAYLTQAKTESNLSFWDIFDLPFESEAEDLEEQKNNKKTDEMSDSALVKESPKPTEQDSNISIKTETKKIDNNQTVQEIKNLGPYKDGEYKASAPTPWGDMDIKVIITNGRWVKINFLKIPKSPPSQYAAVFLPRQALATQNSNIDGVSGATYAVDAFIDDLDQVIRMSKK